MPQAPGFPVHWGGAPSRRCSHTPVRFPIDFNKAEPFVAYMASPEYEQWKAYKNGAKQAE